MSPLTTAAISASILIGGTMRRGTPIETFVERHSGGGGVVGWVGQGLSLIKLDNKLTQLQLPLDAPLDGLW